MQFRFKRVFFIVLIALMPFLFRSADKTWRLSDSATIQRMSREEKALLLYNELAEKADKPDFVNVFKMLCQEEAKHKQILETIYDDFMAEQGD